jgi:hypothetical protein
MKLSSEKLGSVLEQIDAIIQPLDQHPQTGGLVKIVRWDDADPPHLVAHTPEETDVLIKLETAH